MPLESGMNLQDFLSQLSPDELKQLKETLGVSKARAPKEASPEFVAAKAAYDQIVAENPDFVKRLEAAREAMRGAKGHREVKATVSYKADYKTGDISINGAHIANFMEDGWQVKCRQAGLTQGQVAAISKGKKKETTPATVGA